MITAIQKKICLLGDFAVGKTSLIRRYVENRFDERYLSTIGVTISRKMMEPKGRQFNLMIWDIAGGEEFAAHQSSYLRGAAGALLVCDLTRQTTLINLPHILEHFRWSNPQAVFVLVGNKVDLSSQFEFGEDHLKALSETLGGPYVLTSAKTGENVEQAFTLLVERLQGLGF
ncbi:MAG: GTP-binding protein [Anaerolineales bacterium]|nr:GTP-binding protein [Anaerolineales bacterium]